VEMGVVV